MLHRQAEKILPLQCYTPLQRTAVEPQLTAQYSPFYVNYQLLTSAINDTAQKKKKE